MAGDGVSLLAAGILAAALGLGSSVLPGLFTDDRSVLAAIGVLWWFMVVNCLLRGVSQLTGCCWARATPRSCGRRRWRVRWWAFAACLVVAGVWLGLAGIWSGLGTFIVLRLIFVGWRAYSGRWAVTGAA